MPTEKVAPPTLATTREPVAAADGKAAKRAGETAVMDAVIVVLIAWAVLFALVWSLRRHNV